jgi:hypothetical protein
MTLSLLEGAWAAACMPAMPGMASGDGVARGVTETADAMPDMASMEPMAVGELATMKAGGEDADPSRHASHNDCNHAFSQDGANHHRLPECPFAPAGSTQGCSATASLPAHALVVSAASSDDVSAPAASHSEPHLLLTSQLFHPPRA